MTYLVVEGQPEGGRIPTSSITVVILLAAQRYMSFIAKQEIQASFHPEQLWNMEI